MEIKAKEDLGIKPKEQQEYEKRKERKKMEKMPKTNRMQGREKAREKLRKCTRINETEDDHLRSPKSQRESLTVNSGLI